MKISTILTTIVAIAIIAGVVWYLARPAGVPTYTPDTSSPTSALPTTQTSVQSTTTTTTVTPAAQTGAKIVPAPKSFAVNGNDATADVKTITVAAGTPVTITFGADAGTTYHGGLDFRSSIVSTGTIAPGSTKSVSFTATHSFSFTPYWPATNIAKPYTIDVVVK
ncbi:MAG: hypothetical protein V4480_02810 [Patescibacteria group bacterium]